MKGSAPITQGSAAVTEGSAPIMKGSASINAGRGRAPAGYALVVVLMTLGLITVSMLSLWAYLETSAKSSAEAVQKRQTFYICDGATRIIAKLVADWARTNAPPPAVCAGLPAPEQPACAAREYVKQRAGANLENIVPADHVTDSFDIGIFAVGADAPLPNGPFKGLVGRTTTLPVTVQVRKNTRDYACRVEKTLLIAEVGLFQFGLFSGVERTHLSHELFPGSGGGRPLEITGRTHSNGDVCTGSQNHNVTTQGITAARTLYATSDPCGQAPASLPRRATVLGTTFNTDSTNAAPSWIAYADATWGGQVRDSAFGVGPLELVQSMRLQNARDTDDDAHAQTPPAPYSPTLRFLVDPPLPGESEGEKEPKLAYQADIRIIDGVWYLKDPANPASWPGTPIWSDHPGDAVERMGDGFIGRLAASPAPREVAVGQEQLAAARGWGATRPLRYSYYLYEGGTLAHAVAGRPVPVVSYGGIEVDASQASRPFVPSVISRATTNGGNPADTEYCAGAGVCGGGACDEAVSFAVIAANDGWCGAVNAAKQRATHLLAASSSTFADPHLATGGVRRRMLTTNFDVHAFQDALADANPGELGSYFAGRQFNGIVWISSSWPGAWDDGTGGPSRPSAAGALPYPLCSESLGAQPFDGGGGTQIPSCGALYATGGASWPNAVRVVNAREINERPSGGAGGRLPNGLTVATNLPLYVAGHVNATSVANGAGDTPWVPVLMAGDVVTFLSRAWADEQLFLESELVLPAAGNYPGDAQSTTLHLAVLTGLPRAAGANTNAADLKAALRHLEDWEGLTFRIEGSVAIGHRPVYGGAWDGGVPAMTYAERGLPDRFQLMFDARMGSVAKQPPGAPVFDVQAVRQWERR